MDNFTLYLIHVDIDECLENLHSCQHICTNTNGSFLCSCYEGYALDADGENCTGRIISYWEGGRMSLFPSVTAVTVVYMSL